MATRRKNTRDKLLWTIVLSVFAFVCIFSVVSKAMTIWEKNVSYNHLLVTETKLKKERKSLETEVKNLDDDDYVVKYARDHYIFTQGDEKAVILPEKNHKK